MKTFHMKIEVGGEIVVDHIVMAENKHQGLEALRDRLNMVLYDPAMAEQLKKSDELQYVPVPEDCQCHK